MNAAPDRVRRNTADSTNRDIDGKIILNLAQFIRATENSQMGGLSHRIRELSEEWDVERTLELFMSCVSTITITLAFFVSRWFLLFQAGVLAFFIQHAVQGWCPPLPLVRRIFKVRTRKEIEIERMGLKMLRGDFANVQNPSASDGHMSAEELFMAVAMP